MDSKEQNNSILGRNKLPYMLLCDSSLVCLNNEESQTEGTM